MIRTPVLLFLMVLGLAWLGTAPVAHAAPDPYSDIFAYQPATGAWSIKNGDGAGGFSSTNGAWPPGWDVYAANLNGDSLTDLFLYNRTTGQWLEMLSDGGRDFTSFSGSWSPGWEVVILDLDGNGLSDVFVYNKTNGLWFKCLNVGPGGFVYYGGAWSPDWEIYPARLNWDSLDDLFLYNKTNGLWFKVLSGPGQSFQYLGWGQAWSPPGWEIYPGQFNTSDPLTDFFLYNSTTGVWFLATNDGGGGFTYTSGTWSPDWKVSVADFNADARADLFVYNATNGIWFQVISTGNPANPWAYYQGLWSPGWQVHVTELNVDTRSDLLVYNPASGYRFACLSTGVGSFAYVGSSWSPGYTLVASRFSPATARQGTSLTLQFDKWGANDDWGIGGGGMGPQAFQLARAAGLGWVRYSFYWDILNPSPGVYNWASADAEINAIVNAGMHIYGTIMWAPPWTTGGLPSYQPWYCTTTDANGTPIYNPTPPGCQWGVAPDVNALRTFVQEAVRRYGDRVKYWGFWNESSSPIFWRGGDIVDRIILPGTEAARSVNPNLIFVGPDDTTDRYGTGVLPDVLRRDQGYFQQTGRRLIDVISFHAYGQYDSPEATLALIDGRFYPAIAPYRAGRPVWITEGGYGATDDYWSQQNQEAVLEYLFRQIDARTWINKFIMYRLKGNDPGGDYGIITSTDVPRRGYYGVRRAILGY